MDYFAKSTQPAVILGPRSNSSEESENRDVASAPFGDAGMRTMKPRLATRAGLTFAASLTAMAIAAPAHAMPDALAKCAVARAVAVRRCTVAGRPKGCLREATRAAIDCRRTTNGKRKMDWAAFDACAAAFGQAAEKANCRRAPSMRGCLLPLQRELTNCRRAAGGERVVDWAQMAACGVRREGCESACGRESTRKAAKCRTQCFDTERACEAALTR